MYFHTFLYVLFFIIIYLSCKIFKKQAGYILLLGSFVFYFAAGLTDLITIVCVICINWFLSNKVATSKLWLAFSVFLNISVLFSFKYSGMVFDEISIGSYSYVNIVIPLGISFYTFQLIAYFTDIHSGKVKKIKSFHEFYLFISFFPQLIAGPIVRASQLVGQIKRLFEGNPRRVRLLGFGLGMCLLGLVKKLFFADSLSPFVNEIFSSTPADVFTAWLGAWLFSFQIYFDFSGYTDIAIGSAYLLGVRLPINFRTPYLSISPREFWRRWHITLSTWIRDYLYIPLGGSKHGGIIRKILILTTVMSVAGLWHGANSSFLIWGALWGIYIGVWRFFGKYIEKFVLLSWLLNIMIVTMLWVFFRSPDITYALNYIEIMTGFDQTKLFLQNNDMLTVFFIVSGCGLLIYLHMLEDKLYSSKGLMMLKKVNGPLLWGMQVGVIMWLVLMPSYEVSPFIYFRF